jgi:hypothetical protein
MNTIQHHLSLYNINENVEASFVCVYLSTSTFVAPQSCATSYNCGLDSAPFASLALINQMRLFHQKVKYHAGAVFPGEITFGSGFCKNQAPQSWWYIVGDW